MTLQEAIQTLQQAGYGVTPSLGRSNFHVTWPDGLRQDVLRRDQLEALAAEVKASGSAEQPKFGEAPEVADVARVLIPQYHSHLVEARIRYLYRYGEWSSRGQTTLGRAYRAAPRDQFLLQIDFLIIVNGDEWQRLTPEQRTALVDHELAHCGDNGPDEQGRPKWCIWPHDVEEFSSIIHRHGLWRPALDQFGKAAAPHINQLQFDLRQAAAGREDDSESTPPA